MRALSWTLSIVCLASTARAGPATFVMAHVAGMVPVTSTPPAQEGPVALPTVSGALRDAQVRYRDLVRREAARVGLPVAIADAVARIESGYDATAVGSVGEIGLMQVRPSTAVMLGFRGTEAELAAPEINVHYGVRYLAEAWRLANGDLCRALMKYRAGHGSEMMSPLSQMYCARARAVLGMEHDEASTVGAIPSTAPAEAGGRARKSAQSFWVAHETRVARIRARVEASWRARGWRPI